MKLKRFAGLVLAASLMVVGAGMASAEQQQHTIPVTLTVVHSVHALDVTMPACMPVSVLDGAALTANNVSITNNSRTDGVEVAAVQVENAGCKVADYDAFANSKGTIALRINGCSTHGPGELAISQTAFPVIAPGDSLPLTYTAKVGTSSEVSDLEAAHVIFTLRAVEG